jgi:hypothetical protein
MTQPTSEALRIIAQQMSEQGVDFRTDEHGIEALCLQEAAYEIERLRESLQHCVNAIAEYEKDSSESIRPFLLGALDNARKVLSK